MLKGGAVLDLVEVHLLFYCLICLPGYQDGVRLVILLDEDPVVGIPDVIDEVGRFGTKFCDRREGVYTFSVIHLVGQVGGERGW